MLKRGLDILGATAGLILLSPVLLVLFVAVRLESPGPALHWSRRVGRFNALFPMPKFRSMRIGAPDVATHLLPNPQSWITPLGGFMRRTRYTMIVNTRAAMPMRPATTVHGGRLATAMRLNMNEEPHMATSASKSIQSRGVRCIDIRRSQVSIRAISGENIIILKFSRIHDARRLPASAHAPP